MRSLWSLWMILGIANPAWAYTIVGNGDDGSDLEGLTEISSGPISEARVAAVERLEHLGVRGVAQLGALIPEVSKSTLYLAKQNVPSRLDADKAKYHSDESGRVFARTLAEPHASTRFFPISEGLDRDRLVALHIHEALHRALPANVREDESVVAEVTLAIVSPDASQDSIRRTVEAVAPRERDLNAPADPGAHAPLANAAASAPFLGFPSSFGYSFQNFLPGESSLGMRLNRSHVIESNLYPFGGADTPFGMGLMFSVWETDRGFLTGPLGISARLRLWTRNRFEVGIWGQAAMHMLSNEELKNSLYGRDFYSAGLFMRKTESYFYVENFLGISAPSQAKERIGATEYTYDYGEVINAKIRAGVRLGRFDLGGFGEIHLGEYLRMHGGKTREDLGRFRIVSVGPEITYTWDRVTFGVNGRFILDHTDQADLTYVGNLFGAGTGQGHLGTLLRVSF